MAPDVDAATAAASSVGAGAGGGDPFGDVPAALRGGGAGGGLGGLGAWQQRKELLANFDAAANRMHRAGFPPGSYELVKGFANQVKIRYMLDSLDFVYYDARKDYAGVKEDLLDWFARLRPGGVLAGHHFCDGARDAACRFTVHRPDAAAPGGAATAQGAGRSAAAAAAAAELRAGANSREGELQRDKGGVVAGAGLLESKLRDAEALGRDEAARTLVEDIRTKRVRVQQPVRILFCGTLFQIKRAALHTP